MAAPPTSLEAVTCRSAAIAVTMVVLHELLATLVSGMCASGSTVHTPPARGTTYVVGWVPSLGKISASKLDPAGIDTAAPVLHPKSNAAVPQAIALESKPMVFPTNDPS